MTHLGTILLMSRQMYSKKDICKHTDKWEIEYTCIMTCLINTKFEEFGRVLVRDTPDELSSISLYKIVDSDEIEVSLVDLFVTSQGTIFQLCRLCYVLEQATLSFAKF